MRIRSFSGGGGGAGALTWPLLAPDGTAAAPSYSFASDPTTGVRLYSSNLLVFTAGGADSVFVSATTLSAPIFSVGHAQDVFLQRDGPGLLAQRNGATAQTFRLYETYTDPSNWTALEFITGASTVIRTKGIGTGPWRNLVLGTNQPATGIVFAPNNTPTWFLLDDQHFKPGGDASQDIGSPTQRLRDVHVGHAVQFTVPSVPGTPVAGNGVLYMKADKKLYFKNDAGVETALW